jgi:acetolactate synthase-1/2/3 large subunit
LTTRLGVDLIPANHELSIGMPGSIAPRSANFALQNSDWLLILGARLDMALIAYAPDKLARSAKKIMVNIDLAEIQKLGSAIDITVQADAKLFIEEIVNNSQNIKQRNRSSWLKRCQVWKEKYPFVLPEHRTQTGKISIYAFAEIISQEISGSTVILPGNAGNASELFLTAFSVKMGQRVLHNKGTGAMGFSQPASIGACLASGGKSTICVDGDGGFQMNIQELETVRRLNLPIKFFVMNNGGYASIRASQHNYFGQLTGADASSGMTLPDVVKVARAYGIQAMRIKSAKNLQVQIRHVLDMPGPVVCDVMIIPDEPRSPRVSSMQKPDGSMVSKPLEDMWPFLGREEFLSNMIVPPLEEG